MQLKEPDHVRIQSDVLSSLALYIEMVNVIPTVHGVPSNYEYTTKMILFYLLARRLQDVHGYKPNKQDELLKLIDEKAFVTKYQNMVNKQIDAAYPLFEQFLEGIIRQGNFLSKLNAPEKSVDN